MAIVPNDTRFIGINPTVDLRERRSARINRETQPHAMQDITDSIRPYKVFTALLTQTGAGVDDVLQHDNLTIGVTYKIKDTGSGFDFTNVGAPNNDYLTSFVATGTTPNRWSDGQLIYNAGAPKVIVLENTIGNIWFEYKGAGQYKCYSDNLFTEDKTTVFISDTVNTKSGVIDPLQMRVLCSTNTGEQPTYLNIYTGRVGASYQDDIITSSTDLQYAVTFEIRVYN